MVLVADEAVEVLEPRPRGRAVEGPDRARLEHRDLVTLAELRRRVPIQLEDLCERRPGIRTPGVVARRRGRSFGDPTHADGVMVAAGPWPVRERKEWPPGGATTVGSPARTSRCARAPSGPARCRRGGAR